MSTIAMKGGETMTDKKTMPEKAKAMIPKKTVNKVKQTVNKTMHKAGTKGGAAMIGTAAGVVVGAAVGGIAGAALTDKKTRQKLTTFSKNAVDMAEKVSDKATELSEKTDSATKQFAGDIQNLQNKTKRN